MADIFARGALMFVLGHQGEAGVIFANTAENGLEWARTHRGTQMDPGARTQCPSVPQHTIHICSLLTHRCSNA